MAMMKISASFPPWDGHLCPQQQQQQQQTKKPILSRKTVKPTVGRKD